jgi:hypothetical protein
MLNISTVGSRPTNNINPAFNDAFKSLGINPNQGEIDYDEEEDEEEDDYEEEDYDDDEIGRKMDDYRLWYKEERGR